METGEMNASVAYPVQVLREHVTGLEAAISVCLGDPGHKPVHKLRTETRRVEALLVLLELIPALPDHRKQAATLRQGLTRLRRAAGEVRDLDVHRKMLESLAGEQESTAKTLKSGDGEPAERPASSARKAKHAAKAGEPEAASATGAEMLSQSAAELSRRLGHKREKAAVSLKALLEARQAKTVRAAESLVKVLQPGEDFALPAADLLRDAEIVLTRDGLLGTGHVRRLDRDQLHTVRKAAKRARYLAECLPGDAMLLAAAKRFEALQEAGGQWHDALELAQAARRHFGKGHGLTAAYRAERKAKLATYRAALASVKAAKRKTSTAQAPGRKPVRASKTSSGRKTARAAA